MSDFGEMMARGAAAGVSVTRLEPAGQPASITAIGPSERPLTDDEAFAERMTGRDRPIHRATRVSEPSDRRDP